MVCGLVSNAAWIMHYSILAHIVLPLALRSVQVGVRERRMGWE